ncbi:hypothetical protein LSH36_34g07034 [Paralvinella palmiformis]|uniref:Uncharacterized protein n=1 Tax=Paralvinella palmiformis TaxID=53620 RepID=A0AAD9K871_9ANNE|nr:hypothetical protein LSH36_34g07034 [Paralvinella palmiformis]
MINIMKKTTHERRSSSGGRPIALPVNDTLPDSSVKGKDGKKNIAKKYGKNTQNKAVNVDESDEESFDCKLTSDSLMMSYTNADTLTNKMKKLQLLTNEYCLDIIMDTEIKPKYSVDAMCVSSFSMEGYQVYTNLEGEEHSGVVIYISNNIDPLVTEVKFDTNYSEGIRTNTGQAWSERKLAGPHPDK